MTQDSFILRCPKCGTRNRIPAARAGQRATCGRCHAPLPSTALFPHRPVVVTDNTFEEEVAGFPGPVATIFWATWCVYCRQLLPIFDELASRYSEQIKFVKAEQEKNPYAADRYQVQSLPTLLLFHGGRVMNRLVGAVSKDQLEHHLRALL